jgi:hypothetical protein
MSRIRDWGLVAKEDAKREWWAEVNARGRRRRANAAYATHLWLEQGLSIEAIGRQVERKGTTVRSAIWSFTRKYPAPSLRQYYVDFNVHLARIERDWRAVLRQYAADYPDQRTAPSFRALYPDAISPAYPSPLYPKGRMRELEREWAAYALAKYRTRHEMPSGFDQWGC